MTQKQSTMLGGRYELLKTIGSGSYGKVKMARDIRTGSFVAVKIMRKQDPKTGRDHLPAISNEISALRRLGTHPFITVAHEVLITQRRVFLAMRLAAGEVLSRLASPSGAIPERRARYVFQQLVETLVYAHRMGVAHRDIKPSNLLVSERGDLILSDFGLCTMAPPTDEPPATAPAPELVAATACGSPHYVAPEVVNRHLGAGSYNPFVADVWSLGVTLFALLTGEVPFRGQTYRELYAAARAGVILWPCNVRVSQDAMAIVRGLCTPDPAQRWTLNQVRASKWYRGGFADAMASVDQSYICEGAPSLPVRGPVLQQPILRQVTPPASPAAAAPDADNVLAAESRALAVLNAQTTPADVSSRSDCALMPDCLGSGFFSAFEFVGRVGVGHAALATWDAAGMRSWSHDVAGRAARVAEARTAGRSGSARKSPGGREGCGCDDVDPLDLCAPRQPPPQPERHFAYAAAAGRANAKHLRDIEEIDIGSPCGLACVDCTEDLTCPSSNLRNAKDPLVNYFVGKDFSSVLQRAQRFLTGTSIKLSDDVWAAIVSSETSLTPGKSEDEAQLNATLAISSAPNAAAAAVSRAGEASLSKAFTVGFEPNDANDICERIDLQLSVRRAGPDLTWCEVLRLRGSLILFRQVIGHLKNSFRQF